MISASTLLSALALAIQASAPASRPFRLADAAGRPVARVGAREVTVGEIVEAARAFYPEVRTELDGDYGEEFLRSGGFDDWIDAYVDLLVLKRDPRVTSLLPPAPALEKALLEQAAVAGGDKFALERARRLRGFDAARQAQLDLLVPAEKDPAALRRFLIQTPEPALGRVRLRHLILPTRDPITGKRLPQARREQLRSDAERIAARLRGGDPFEEVVRQVSGPKELRSKDVLPWISYGSPLPGPILDALFFEEPKELVGPIEVRDGIYLGKVEERSRIRPPEFEKIADQLSVDMRRKNQYELLRRLRGETEILVY